MSRIVFTKIISTIVVIALLGQILVPATVLPAVEASPHPFADKLISQLTDRSTMTLDPQPSGVSQPISISRVQSSYQAGNDLTVTYRVRNNQNAVSLPEISAGLDLTDTIASMSGFDPWADPNTMRGVIVNSELINGATFLDASIWPDANGSQLLFSLGDIAPLATVTFSVTVAAPAAAADFLELDGGTTAYGTFQGRSVSVTAPPIRLAPDGFQSWLASTPDAAREDEAMLFQVAEVGDDPLALFRFNQEIEYESYSGSLRGTRGTLWSRAGNSIDQSSLLIAMLRSAGYPARYRHGTLSLFEAQALITGMFETPATIRGQVSPEAEISDPINDAELLAETQDHWWVEAYLPGSGWVNLDPTINSASLGDVIATPIQDGTDQIVELPDAVRHKLDFTLDVEKYNSFPLGGLNLQLFTVLTATIPTAQAAGIPVNIAFAVESSLPGGMVYATTEHTYTPYLAYGDGAETIFGTPIQDVLTNFPLATQFTTGIWLEVTSTAPDGSSDTYRRTIKDLIGADLRQGGNAQLPPRDESPLISSSDLIQVQPIPNSAYPASEVDRIIHAMFQQLPSLVDAYDGYLQLDDSSGAEAISAFADDQLPALYEAQFAQLDLMSAMFQFASTWDERPIGADTVLVKSYPDRPKLILSSQVAIEDGSLETSFELLNIAEKSIAYPGQNLEAVKSANFLRTSTEKILEYEILSLFLPGEVKSAVGTLLAAEEQGIPTRYIVAENLAELDDLAIPAVTKAHITAHANAGSLVAVPEQMVTMPYGEDIGFMVVDPDGNTSYVNADGHMAAAALMYALQNKEVIIVALIRGTGLAFVGGFMAYIFSFLSEVFVVALALPPLGPGQLPGAIAGDVSGKGLYLSLLGAASAAIPLPIGACTASPNPPACEGGVMAGYGFVVTAIVAGMVGGGLDPSLTDFWVSDLPLPTLTTVSTTTLTAVPTLAGPVGLDVTAGHYWGVSSALSGDWTSNHIQSAQFNALTATSVDLFQNGLSLGSGSLTVTGGRAQFDDSSRLWSLTGNSHFAGYAPAANGLAATQVGAYDASVTGNPDLSGQLDSSNINLNNTAFFAGTVEATFNSSVSLTGQGTAPAPNFATTHTWLVDQGELIVSSIDGGTVDVGGTAVTGVQSVALGGYTGPIDLADGGDLDQVVVNGPADFFALTAVPGTLNATVNAGILITPNLLSNYSDTYTLTVSVPDGWTIDTLPGGSAVVTPTAKAAPSDANVLVTAQSARYPDLFASAAVTLNLAESQGVDVSVAPDPLVTIPMGVPQGSDYDFPLTLNHDADGQAEVPGAAFNVTVHNDSTAAATFDLSVAGLPSGWALWSNSSGTQTSVTLAAGAQQTIGLYVVPPDGPLPSAGTNYPFTVIATDRTNGSIMDSDSNAFTMPVLPFPYLTVEPLRQAAMPGELVTVSLTLQNVGNAASSFPISVTVRDNHFSTAVVSPTVLLSASSLETGLLAPNASFSTDMVITTTGSMPGLVYFVEARSAAGEYDPMALASVQFVSPLTAPIYRAADSCNLGNASLSAALGSLALAVTGLENSLDNGSYDLALRDDVVAMAASVADYARVSSNYLTADDEIRSIADTLATQTDDTGITANLNALSSAVADLEVQLCELEEHLPVARFTPYVDAILLGDSADFSLDVTNQGSITTTYAITITGLPGGDTLLNQVIGPGETVNVPVTPSPTTLGAYDLTAHIHPTGPDVMMDIAATTVARLNVVEKFVQVTQVIADPAFVETGISSTTLKMEVANFAGVALDVNVQAAILDNGGGVQFTADVPVTILAGNPRLYDLTTVNTSGWSEGVYSITVNLLDDNDDPVSDGFGYGFLSVGQALVASQALRPAVVAPGSVTTTVIITTEHTTQFLPPEPLRVPSQSEAGSSPPPSNLSRDNADRDANRRPLTPLYAEPITATRPVTDSLNASAPSILAATTITISGVFTRTEQDDTVVTTTGSWITFNNNKMSGGSYARADGAGHTAALTFYGDWVNVGFLGDRFSGQVEIFIDGNSQGVLDLYRRDPTAISFIYDELITATHTISLTTQGTANPYAGNDYVQLDYFDAWNGTDLPQGTFEEDDSRIIASPGWTTFNDGAASGGTYIRGNTGTTWLPFTGDSFSYHVVRTNANGWTQLHVDGHYLTTINTWSSSNTTGTFSYQGFGPGPHLLQVSTYRGTNTTVDAFTTPGSAPFDDPDPLGNYTRFEEDHPAWLYNGVPYTRTVPTWNRLNFGVGDWASRDQAFYSQTAGDTAVITVDGVWINLGLGVDSTGGQAEIFLDGVSQGVMDLYRHDAGVTSRIFSDLSPGSHTISVTVQGSGNVWIDYVDAWDGVTLPDGTFTDSRIYFGGGWRLTTFPEDYWNRGKSAWFPFNGDTVTYQAIAYNGGGKVKLFVDEQDLGVFDLFNSSFITYPISFNGLGNGLHVLRVQEYRGNSTLKSFVTPGSPPYYQPPDLSGIIRYEEDNPALLYNGVPYTQTVTSWKMVSNPTFGSEAYAAESATVGDSVSLTFEGAWVGVGFMTQQWGGQADIYLDGVWQKTVDLYSNDYDTLSVYFDGLINATHTISVTVLGTGHPNARDERVQVDYFDVWDGSTMPDGVFEEDDARIIYSAFWSEVNEADASGGGYAEATSNQKSTTWFPFTGDSVTYQAWAYRSAHEVAIKIDGDHQGIFDIFSDKAMTQTLSFDGLGNGPHMMEIRAYRSNITLDAFISPGRAPFYQEPPPPTGIVRYEEDDPELLYNGYPFTQTVHTWWPYYTGSASNGYVARTTTPGNWVSLEFYGSWAGVGFGQATGVAEVFIDGTSMITVDLSLNSGVGSVYFSDLPTNTHTISVTALSGNIYFDFFDAWDGTQMGDGWFEADLDEHTGPYHYSNLKSWYTQYGDFNYPRIDYARDGDVVGRAKISSPTHMWFAFTGHDLLFLPFQHPSRSVEVFIDGLSQGVVDLTPQYSAQPYALYYQDLGDGPHVAHIDATNSPFIDAFQVNPPDFLPYTPMVEWTDLAPTDIYSTTFANRGLLSTAGIGDLDGDGIVEVVAPASNGQLYVYRGDGQDAGGGTPLLWQTGLVGAGAEPSLADLDGDGKAEIIVMGTDGTAAFHADGSTYWFTDTIQSTVEKAGWSGSSVANLDLEPGPEIVLAAYNDALYVLDHDGSILFTDPTSAFPTVPTLADITGDGMLDILAASDKTLTVYDAFNAYNIAWTRTHTYTGFYGQAFGAVAVADVDGKQPGGDDGPEVIINWGHYVDVLDADGTLLWNYYFGSDSFRRPSPITVADVDGDNEIEILTASALQSGFLIFEHVLLALNADGTLLWSQSMGDNTASASGVATQDLDGDGVWEVLWNGAREGFTILDGPTGTKLFNEEFSESGTFVDYPALGDVDGDGFAEVVSGGTNGLVIYGHDGVWGDSRPLWNQHNYHVTNINDDWSVPINEFNSWDVHNTYRTQTPDRSPAPSYQVALTYTAVLTEVAVLTQTASIPLTENIPDYLWGYRQDWYQQAVTTTFDVALSDMQPGEVRRVSEGVQISYKLPSGINYLTLPPLYVSTPRVVGMSPAALTVPAGSTAIFDIRLANPSPTASATYTLTLAGIPSEWTTYPATVLLAAGEEVVVPLTITIPADAARDTLPVIVDIVNESGGTDSDMALMTIVDGLELMIAPDEQIAVPNLPVTYTLAITNLETTSQTYTLTSSGLPDVNLPASIPASGGESVTVTFTATATSLGPQPFTVWATATSGAQDSDDAILNIPGAPEIEVSLLPETVVGGPGSQVNLSVRLTNNGSLADTFKLSAVVPLDWAYEFLLNGQPVTAIMLSPGTLNEVEVTLAITPDNSAALADYPISVTAQAQTTAVTGMANGIVALSNRGVQVMFVSGDTAVDPGDTASWQVQVTNTGTVADTFDLLVSGFIAVNAQFSQNSVTLNPGQSQTVQLSVSGLGFALPQTVAVLVAAQSQTDAAIYDEDSTNLTFNSLESVDVSWLPATQTVAINSPATYLLVVVNTGNIATTYQVDLDAPSLAGDFAIDEVLILPHMRVSIPLTVYAAVAGPYTLTGTADSNSGTASDSDVATLTVLTSGRELYLPLVSKTE